MKKKPDSPELTRSLLARILAPLYRLLPERIRVQMIAVIWNLERGQLHSFTARQLLLKFHDVSVGAHSYGSLLIPGMAQSGTAIGRYVSIGPNVRRYNTNHPLDALSLHPYWYNPILGLAKPEEDMKRTKVLICDDAWVGANVILLPACTRIGVGATVGAGAIVTRDVEDFEVVSGVPARSRGLRLTPELRTDLLKKYPWQFAPTECKRVLDSIH